MRKAVWPTVEFIIALFFEIDKHMRVIPEHPRAHLWPREMVTLGLLHALKGVGNRAFYPSVNQFCTAYFWFPVLVKFI